MRWHSNGNVSIHLWQQKLLLLVRRLALVFLIAVISGALPTAAQHDHPATEQNSPPDHCRYSPAISFSALPPAVLMEGIGTSSIKVTTNSEQAQRFFNQGLNLLHCFWDTEAYRAFREATRKDENCAMAYWGIFTALAQNSQEMAAERSAALKKAVELSARTSEHEQYYIRAASLLVEPGKGRAAWMSEMEALIDRFPDDVEAQLLLANSLSTPTGSYSPDGRPREGKLYGQAILRHLLITHPNHAAAHHYWIHAVENGPRPQDALPSAAKLPTLAPGSGHMLHMPGHIYYRLGRYEEARRAFLASEQRDQEYMKQQQINPINNWNYVHNLDYLVGNCAEDGRYQEGVKWAEVLRSVPIDQERLRATGAGYILYGGYTALARLQMRYGMWEAAAKSLAEVIPQTTATGSLSHEYLKGVLLYLKGMAAIEQGRADEASTQAQALDALLQDLSGKRSQLGADWYFNHASRILNVHASDLRGSLLSVKGEHEAAFKLLRETAEKEKALGYWEPPHYARPVCESLGQAAIRAGKYDLAKEAYTQALKLRPESGHALLGLAQACEMAGEKDEARRQYQHFLAAWRNADATLPQMSAAKEWMKKNATGRPRR